MAPVPAGNDWKAECERLRLELEERRLNDTSNFPTGPEEMFGVGTNNPKGILNAMIPPNSHENL